MALSPSQIQDYYSSQSTSKTPLSPAQYEASLAPKPPAPVATPTVGPGSPGYKPNEDPANAAPTGANEPGANPALAGTPGHDIFGAVPRDTNGNPIAGTPLSGGGILATPVGGSPTTGTPATTTGTTTQTSQVADQADADQKAKELADFTAKSKSVQDTLTGISNGSIPLSPGDQAQVDGLKQQFQQFIDSQMLQNKGAVGLANMRGFENGNIAGQNPLFQANIIGDVQHINTIVGAGAAKVTDLMVKESAAVAQLTQALQDKNIARVKDVWAIYQETFDKRQAAFQKAIDDTQAAIKEKQDQQMKVDQYNLDVAKFQQTGDQQAFDNAFKQEQQAFDEKYKKDTLSLDWFKANQGAGGGGIGENIQSTTIAPSGGPDPMSQQATYDQIAKQYGPMTAVAIKGLANYEISPTAWSSRATKGMTQAQAITLAKMYDPTYNEAMYATRAGYMKSLASSQTGTVGSAVNSANKSINHLTAYVTSMGQLGATPSSLTNRLLYNTAGKMMPGERQTLNAAQTEGLGVAEELAKFFKGSGTVDVASIDAWKNQLSPYSSPADVRGLTQGAITLLAGQLETLAEQYQSTMGKTPENNFLNPSAMASLSSLKNQGYNVPIQGVYYSDVNAYKAHDSNAKANMATAVQQLTAAGLPLTPDNILQLAQQQ